jgi:enediyne biosynthesis protein E4
VQVGATLLASGVQVCDAPELRNEAPFDLVEFPSARPNHVRMYGAGVAVGDFAGDGLPDALMFGTTGASYLVHEAAGWKPDPPGGLEAGLAFDMGFGGSVADVDDDGDLDVFVTRYTQPNLLLLNDGRGHFEEAAVERGIDGGMHRSSSSAWADFDGDGDLDLAVGGHGLIIEDGRNSGEFPPGEKTWLYQNDGQGFFTDVSNLLPPGVQASYTFVPAWVDVDRDGLPDLYLINDIGWGYAPCRLVWNRGGGVFEPDNGQAGLDLPISGMGLAIGDTNRDGVLDFLVPAWAKNGYMVSDAAAGVWENQAESQGLAPSLGHYNQRVGWAAEFADMDLDTRLDAVVVYGFIQTQLSPNTPGQPDALYLQTDDGSFVDAAPTWGVADSTAGRGLVVADINRDGHLDLAKPSVDGPRRIYLSRCSERAWLTVTLRAEAPNTHAVGAHIRVYAEGQTWERTVYAGSTSYASGGPPEVHFGLGDLQRVDAIEVLWPDGGVSRFDDLPTRQALTVERSLRAGSRAP